MIRVNGRQHSGISGPQHNLFGYLIIASSVVIFGFLFMSKNIWRIIDFTVVFVGCLFFTGCATVDDKNAKTGVPTDVENGRFKQYKSIDELIQAFQEAGAQVRNLDNGNVIDVIYRPKVGDTQSRITTNLLESICSSMLGKEHPKDSLFPNLRTEPWYYIYAAGGPIISFNQQVDNAYSLIKDGQTSYWGGALGSIGKVNGNQANLCTSYVVNKKF